MKSRLFLLLTALLVIATPDRAADYRKMSAHVRGMMIRQQVQPFASRGIGTARQSSRSLTAFVRIKPSEADDVWRQYDCKCHTQVGDIAIVSIPLSSLDALSDHPAVHRIEASPTGRLNMDTTAVIVGIDKLQPLTIPLPLSFPAWLRQEPSNSFTGKGIVVGLVDVGFDLTHPNFYDSSVSASRIGAFWDQLSRDTVGSTLPIGRDFKGADLAAVQHSTDGFILSHGTHTLGIAAGSGYDSPYRGVAPDADICLVSNAVTDNIELIDSADYDKFTTAVDALGFQYIFNYADSLGKPCVISFSEGYPPYSDEEDSLYADFLGQLTGPGRIIVSAAGNESVHKTFVEKPAGTPSAGAFIRSGNEQALYRIKTDGPIGLSVYAYQPAIATTDSLQHLSTSLPVDSVITDSLFLGNDTLTVSYAKYASSFANDTIVLVYFSANRELSKLPGIALTLHGTETHAELYGSSSYSLTSNAVDPRWNNAVAGHNIHAPGCFSSVICVGATAHRLGFTNYKGEYKDYASGRTVGRLSPYSSTGSTITGLQKPDVVAPGDNIISSYSSYYLEQHPEASDISSDVAHFDFQGRTYAWNANTGTSMATPVVAGVISLWLQACPDLSREDIIGVLSRTCRQPDATLSYPNNQYGYGEINAYRGLLDILGIDRIEGLSTHQPLQAAFRLQGRTLHVSGIDGGTLSIYSVSGQLLQRTQLSADGSVDLTALPPGLYAVQLSTSSPSTTGSTLIRL